MSEGSPKEGERKRLSIFADTKPNSVKTLRASYRDRLRMPDPDVFLKEMMGESDRAAIILSASALDDLLLYAIALKLSCNPTGNEIDYIFRQAGPLGTFSARMEIALLFDVIEDETYQQLDTIREMRNACAHSKHPLTLKDSALAVVAMRLFEPLGFIPVSFAQRNLKMAFSAEVSVLQQTLVTGSRAEARKTAVGYIREEVERRTSLGESP